MNSKTILKRILPIIIALVVIIGATLVVALATQAKRVPTFASDEYGEEAYFTYENNGVTIQISRDKVYQSLRGSDSAASDTISNLVDMIDNDLLSEYVSKVNEEDAWDIVANDIFGNVSFDKYIKDNAEKFKVAAKKDNKNYDDYLKEQIEDLIETYVKNSRLSGINASKDDFTYIDSTTNKLIVAYDGETKRLDDDGEEIYLFKVKATSAEYASALIEAARNDYARVQIEKEYKEDLEKYNKYLADVKVYESYTEALAQYEEDLEDWKNSDKSTRGDKPVKPSKDNYTVTSSPEVVEAPVLVESDFESLYETENYNKYNAILIPYTSTEAAEAALLQNGVVVAYKTTDKSGTTKYAWFHYGTTDYATASASQKAEIEAYDYTTKGKSTIITDNDYYRLLTLDSTLVDEKDGIIVASSTSPDPRTGAYQLSEKEIQELIIKLYNQFYQSNPEKQLVLDTDYTISEDYDIVLTNSGKEKTAYDEGELTTLGLYSTSTSNRFNKFKEDEENAFDDVYSGSIVTASSLYYLYLITNKDTNDDWEDYLDDINYYETTFYSDHLAELLDGKNTATYVKTSVAELRNDNGLLIYDEVLETSYMSTYTSEYKATKKSSKNVVASYKVDGEKKEITVEQLFDRISGKNGIITSYDSYQYDWVFLAAANEEGTIFNKYFDYKAYKDGKKYNKCFLDNNDAKELKDGIESYTESLKNSFSSGYLESSGYPATYGWDKFIKDYFSAYGSEIETLEDVKVYLIYREIVSDYMEYVSKVDEDVWNNLYLTYMAKTMSTYINTTGIHTLIGLNNEDGNKVDPVNWTSEQITAAKELYDEILNLIKVVPTDKISTVLNAITTTFNAAPLLKDGTTPNYSYQISSIDGTKYSYDLFNYDYQYYVQGSATPITVHCAKYKSMGFNLTTEDLTVTAGTMVTEFEDAVRQIWNNQINDLVTGETVNKAEIYDHSYNPTEYKNMDTVVNYTGTEGYLVTEFGFHVYTNLTSSMSTYFTTDNNNDKVFIGLPSRVHSLMYVYENTKSSELGYKSFTTLYTRYEEAVEDNNSTEIESLKTTIMKVVKDELQLELTFDEFYEYLKAYADTDTSAYVLSQINTWFTNYTTSTDSTGQTSNSSSFTLMYNDLSGSSYYQLEVMKNALSNISKFTDLEENNIATLEDVLNYYVDSYYGALTTATFVQGTKDDVEELLNAINYLENYNIFVENADKLLTSGYTAEKATLAQAFNSLKTYTKNAYNNLSTEDKAELQDLANKAGILA